MIVFQEFISNIIAILNLHLGFLANNVEPDLPLQKLADQALHCHAVYCKLHYLADVKVLYLLAKHSNQPLMRQSQQKSSAFLVC